MTYLVNQVIVPSVSHDSPFDAPIFRCRAIEPAL